MTVDLTLHGRPIGTVFDLLGKKENDITYSVGWAMAQCAGLAEAFIADVLPDSGDVAIDLVQLQEGMPGAGFTDIELKAAEGKIHVVIEAKRGYSLPGDDQLAKYATRTDPQPTALVVIAEASAEFVAGKLSAAVEGVPVHYRSWRRLDELVTTVIGASRNNAEKRLLRDLSRYLRGLMTMQNVNSNLVYVVALGGEIEKTGISFQEVVTKHGTYFCPVGGGYPKEPPNYLGFRFEGKLQQIRHVDSYRVTDDNYAGFELLKGKVDWPDERHWVFQLGPVIVPPKDVRTGGLYGSHRGWIAIDLLLTCDTVAEALERTNARQGCVRRNRMKAVVGDR
jgi:hypothetical protein